MSNIEKLRTHYDGRSKNFEQSVRWVTDKNFIETHLKLAGLIKGKALELCCGTGALSRGLKAGGWDVHGIDISPGMVEEASKHIRARIGDATRLPFPDRTFDLMTMRQSFCVLDDAPAALKEVRRALKQSGRFILSQLVPFSEVDQEHFGKILDMRSAQPRKLQTADSLTEELQRNAFTVVKKKFVTVRESVTRWMDNLTELPAETRQAVCDLVVNAPDSYRKLHNVEVRNGEIFEDWNFVLLLGQPRPM